MQSFTPDPSATHTSQGHGMDESPGGRGRHPGKRPFGTVLLPQRLPLPPGPIPRRRLPARHPGPSVPLPVLSIEALRHTR